MKSKSLALAAWILLASCSGMNSLTRQDFDDARNRWAAAHITSYNMIVQMSGDRLDRSEYEVQVLDGRVLSLKRNGQEVNPAQGQDYSMDGLFGVIEQEMTLSEEDPSKLGAPEGYKSYLMASFDRETGRLLKYRRAVGGANNSIDIVVEKFEPQKKTGA